MSRSSLLSDLDAHSRRSGELSEIIIGAVACWWAAWFIFLLAGILAGCGNDPHKTCEPQKCQEFNGTLVCVYGEAMNYPVPSPRVSRCQVAKW